MEQDRTRGRVQLMRGLIAATAVITILSTYNDPRCDSAVPSSGDHPRALNAVESWCVGSGGPYDVVAIRGVSQEVIGTTTAGHNAIQIQTDEWKGYGLGLVHPDTSEVVTDTTRAVKVRAPVGH